jgi:hypothetical protein
MNKALAVLTLSTIVSGAFADDLSSQAAERRLDIAKVIGQTTESGACGLEAMQLKYLDSKGALHTLDYMILGSGCSNG